MINRKNKKILAYNYNQMNKRNNFKIKYKIWIISQKNRTLKYKINCIKYKNNKNKYRFNSNNFNK